MNRNIYDRDKICQRIYRRIFDNLRSELAVKIENVAKNPSIWEEAEVEYQVVNTHPLNHINGINSRSKSPFLKCDSSNIKNNPITNTETEINHEDIAPQIRIKKLSSRIYKTHRDLSLNHSNNIFDKNDNIDDKNEVLNFTQYNLIKSSFIESLNVKDKSFGQAFTNTQIFISYFEDMRIKLND